MLECHIHMSIFAILTGIQHIPSAACYENSTLTSYENLIFLQALLSENYSTLGYHTEHERAVYAGMCCFGAWICFLLW